MTDMLNPDSRRMPLGADCCEAAEIQPQATARVDTPDARHRMPHFFIVGAAKSGTTTLYQHLERHPELFLTTPKEMSFFSKDQVYLRGFEWYSALFEMAEHSQRWGEASTTYTRWPTYEHAAARMHAAAPNARLVYILRSPVERLYAFYGHRMRREVTMGLDEFLRTTDEAIHSGNYMTQIKKLLEYFPREQLHVLLLEDLIHEPTETLASVYRHLGVSVPDSTTLPLRANAGGGALYASSRLSNISAAVKANPVLRRTLHAIPAPTRHRLYQWAAGGLVGRWLKRSHTAKLTPLTSDRKRELWDLFADEIAALEKFLGRDLSRWRPSCSR